MVCEAERSTGTEVATESLTWWHSLTWTLYQAFRGTWVFYPADRNHTRRILLERQPSFSAKSSKFGGTYIKETEEASVRSQGIHIMLDRRVLRAGADHGIQAASYPCLLPEVLYLVSLHIEN